jgi:hypothetical protein
MKLTVTTLGNFGQIMAEEVRAGEKAATATVRRAGNAIAPNEAPTSVSAGRSARITSAFFQWLPAVSGQAGNVSRFT